MLALITLAALVVQVPPQLPQAAVGPQMRFVDYSTELARPGVSVVIGRLGRLREGKRERIREGGQLGGATSQAQISGTQYYRVPVRTRIDAPRAVGGAELAGAVELAFDLQLARLPDGTERRQSQTGNGAPIDEGQLALWVVEKPRKGRGLELLHVVPFDAATDRGDDPERTFEATMRDFQDVNRRMLDLRTVLDATGDVTADSEPARRDAALQKLREAVAAKSEMRDPADEALAVQHVEPLLRRVRDRIATLEKDG